MQTVARVKAAIYTANLGDVGHRVYWSASHEGSVYYDVAITYRTEGFTLSQVSHRKDRLHKSTYLESVVERDKDSITYLLPAQLLA